MQGPLAGRIALIAALVAAPVAAAEVYVPAVDPAATDGSRSETELWISNGGTAQAQYSSIFLPAFSDGTKRTGQPVAGSVLAGRSVNVTKVAQSGKTGLVAVQLPAGVVLDARVVSTTVGGAVSVAAVPVISDANRFAAGSKAVLVALERDLDRGRLIHFGLVNLGSAAAQCQLNFAKSDGTAIGSTVLLVLQPLSLAHYTDALNILGQVKIAGVRSTVTCNQPFYAYAALFTTPNTHYTFITPASAAGSGGTTSPGGGTGKAYVFERKGLVHNATTSSPKGIVNVSVPSALSLKRLVLDMDFVAGPWNLEKIPGNHGIVWLYRGKFRSNTVANVNAFGPDKFSIKMNQNVDLFPPENTNAEGGLTLQKGQRYHLHYIYDAENQLVTAQVSSGGGVLRSISMGATASGKILAVPKEGMTAEFGHYFGQEGPEVAWPGASYHELRIEMTSY